MTDHIHFLDLLVCCDICLLICPKDFSMLSLYEDFIVYDIEKQMKEIPKIED